MKPNKSAVEERQGHLYHMELKRMINPEHSRVELAASVDWNAMEEAFGAFFFSANNSTGDIERIRVRLEAMFEQTARK